MKRPIDPVKLAKKHRPDIVRFAEQHGAHNVRVVTYIPGNHDDDERDRLVLLVDMEPDKSLFDVTGLMADLEDVVHQDVLVLTLGAIDEFFLKRVLDTAVPL